MVWQLWQRWGTSVSLSPSLYLTHEPPTVSRNVALPLCRCHAGLFPVGTEGPDWYRDQLQAVRDPPQIQETVSGRFQLRKYTLCIREQGLVILEIYFVAYAYVLGSGELAFFCFVLFFASWLPEQKCSLRGCGKFVIYRMVVNNKATFLPKCTKEMHK